MFKDKFILISALAAILLNIVLWIALFGKFGIHYASIPLHFNVVWGIDLTGSSRQVFELPGLGAVVIAVNFFLIRFAGMLARLQVYFLAAAAVAVQALLWVAAVPLLSLIT